VLRSYGISLADVYQKYSNPKRIVKDVHSTPRLPLFEMQIAGAAFGGVLGATLGPRVTLLLGGLGLVVATLLLAIAPPPGSPRSGHERRCLFCRFQAIPRMAILRARCPSFFISKHRRHRLNPHIPNLDRDCYRLNV